MEHHLKTLTYLAKKSGATWSIEFIASSGMFEGRIMFPAIQAIHVKEGRLDTTLERLAKAAINHLQPEV